MKADPVVEILKWLRPHLAEGQELNPDGSWMLPQGPLMGLTKIITTGKEWLTHEARKKELTRYRKFLQKTRDCRDGSGDLRYLFPSFRNFGPCENPLRHDADALLYMIWECDKILGTKEPARYPRRVIIWESLALWVRFTGKTPPRNAFQPNPHSEDRLAPPYAFTRMIIATIEDCTDTGDFSHLYETIVKKHFPTK